MILYKQYQKQTYKQLVVAQAVIRKDQEYHAEKQELLKPDISAEKSRKTSEKSVWDRFGFANSVIPFFFTFLLALLLAFFSLVTLLCLIGHFSFFRTLTTRRKTRKRIKRASAVIARDLDRHIGAGISVLSRIQAQSLLCINESESFEMLII